MWQTTHESRRRTEDKSNKKDVEKEEHPRISNTHTHRLLMTTLGQRLPQVIISC